MPPRSESTLRSSLVLTRGVTGLEPFPLGVPFNRGEAIGFERTIGLGLADRTFGLLLAMPLSPLEALPGGGGSDERLNIPPINDLSDRDVEECGIGACAGSATSPPVSTGAAGDASVTLPGTAGVALARGSSRLSAAGVSTSIAGSA